MGSARRRQAEKRRLAEARIRLADVSGDDGMEEERDRLKSLSAFIQAAWHTIEPGTTYLHNWHIDAISEHLEAVSAGQILRLCINMPPRCMKSIAVSVMYPVWEWTLSPWMRYMFVTYSGNLSKDHAVSRLTVLRSQWFRERWGSVFELESDNMMDVLNSERGLFTATSMTANATGKGANRLVFDDPHNPKKADSDVERAGGLRLFNTTFQSRLNDKKRDAIINVMQRLHQEDIAARCLALGYVHLCLPAESEGRTVVLFPISGRIVTREDGEILWPEREGPAELAALKESMGSYGYAGQYQQRPAPAGGGMFTTFPIVHAIPHKAERIRYWDKAGTPGGGARTAGVKMASWIASDGHRTFCIEHIVKGQWGAAEREAVIKQTAFLDGHSCHIWEEQEPGSGGKESAENTIKMLPGFVVQREPVTGDKATRARPMAAQAEIGNVSMLEGSWNADFVDEAQSFPNGKYKDQIDAASGAFNKLALLSRPSAGHAPAMVVKPTIPMATGGMPQGIPWNRPD